MKSEEYVPSEKLTASLFTETRNSYLKVNSSVKWSATFFCKIRERATVTLLILNS